MDWTLSEFLNHIDVRSQTWCFAALSPAAGFSIPYDDDLYFYAVLEGQVRIAGSAASVVELREGEVAITLGREAHAVRTAASAPAPIFGFLANTEYGDAPASFSLGEGRPAARLLCGQLKVRWPGAQPPSGLPPLLRAAAKGLVDLPAIAESARGAGSAALLTRAANLLFVEAFRNDPECQAVFRQSGLHDPIARALHYIEMHPFTEWRVETLARKVGMGRANFAARFVAALGRTPFEVLTAERMRHAAAMLAETNLKIAEIAERVGYRSEAAFSRRFALHFGRSPGALRKVQRDGAPAPRIAEAA